MNDSHYVIFLIALSGINLITYILTVTLTYLSISSHQKIKLIKLAVIMINIAPLIFILVKLSSWQTIYMVLPDPLTPPLFAVKNEFISVSNKTISHYIFWGYMIGFIFTLFQIIFSYKKARLFLLDSVQTTIQGQPVCMNKNILGPINFGFLKPKIYLPDDFERKWTPREIELALAHEKMHLNNHDVLWKILSLIARSILFFAPWAYLLHKQFELEMEIRCDKEACIMTKSNINEYGNLLLAIVCQQSRHFIFTHMATSTLKRRFVAMKVQTKKHPVLVRLFSLFLMLVGGTTIALGSGIVNNKTTFDIMSQVYIDGELVSKPRIIVNENQLGKIVISNKDHSNELQMSVVASHAKTEDKKVINITFDVQYKHGNEKIYVKPRLIVKSNQQNKIRIQLDTGHTFDMIILAKENDVTG